MQRTRAFPIHILVLLILLVSCAPKSPAPSGRVDTATASEPDSKPAPPGPVDTPATSEPASDRVVSVVAAQNGGALRIQLRAPSNGSLYLDNCNGAFAWGLEHQVNGVWKPAWMAVINQCHSAPIMIAPGEARIFNGTVSLDPGKTLPADRYRIAIYGLFSRHDQENHRDNPEVPVAMRVSEPIELGPFAPH